MATRTLLGNVRGKSAFEIAVQHGFTGTEEQWLNSLKAQGSVNMTEGRCLNDLLGVSTMPEFWNAMMSLCDGNTVNGKVFTDILPNDYFSPGDLSNLFSANEYASDIPSSVSSTPREWDIVVYEPNAYKGYYTKGRHFALGFRGLIFESYYDNNSGIKKVKETQLMQWLNGAFLTKLATAFGVTPNDFIAPARYEPYWQTSSSFGNDWNTTSKIFLLVEEEVFGRRIYSKDPNPESFHSESGKILAAFAMSKGTASKTHNGSLDSWWLGSAYGDDSGVFCCVRHDGDAYSSDYDIEYGVSPAFLIGRAN